MLSKATIKYIKQIQKKKNRDKESVFFAEGRKIAIELLESDVKILHLFASDVFIQTNKVLIKKACNSIEIISPEELKSISLLSQPEDCFIVAEKKNTHFKPDDLHDQLVIFLDGIRDPGNLGTIIRVCDWFGIQYLFCSPDCVDVYNPKVIQASMGSFLRVMPIYMDLNAIVSNFKGQNLKIPMVYGAFMSGDSVFSIDNFHAGILVIGGEANGIRPELFAMIDRKITIPRFSEKAESLNAAVAASVIISQFKRINA